MSSCTMWGQGGAVPLRVYMAEDAGIPEEAADQISKRLDAVVAATGGAGNGCDGRFVVVPRLEISTEVTTPTIPPKTVLEGNLFIYVGDAATGSLFSSCSLPIKSLGNGKSQALKQVASAINVNNSSLRNTLTKGRERIVEFFNDNGPQMLKQAEAAEKMGDHEQALGILYSIPSVCVSFEAAMEMAAKFGQDQLEKDNAKIVQSARAEWSASPDEYGAQKAMEILKDVNPSTPAGAQAKQLCAEMNARLQRQADNAYELEKARIATDAATEQARIKADASVRKEQQKTLQAYYNSRPQPVYVIHWW